MFNQLKKRWGINSNIEIIAILLTFCINGTFATTIAAPILKITGINTLNLTPWLFWPLRILLIFIVYQTSLPLIGWFLGQHLFFKRMQQQMLHRLKLKK